MRIERATPHSRQRISKMLSIYNDDPKFGPDWEINPICIRYRSSKDYSEWLKSIKEDSKQEWISKHRNGVTAEPNMAEQVPNFTIHLLENIDNPEKVLPKIAHFKNICVLFTEYCDTLVLKSHSDLNNANYLDIKIPLMIDDTEFPYINLLKGFIQNSVRRKVLHLDFRDWPMQMSIVKAAKAAVTADPVVDNIHRIISEWGYICTIINNASHLEHIKIEIIQKSMPPVSSRLETLMQSVAKVEILCALPVSNTFSYDMRFINGT